MRILVSLSKSFSISTLTLIIVLEFGLCDLDQLETEEAELENIYGFGAAKHFMPLPNTVVGSHCAWELRLNTVADRIPETITEILCHAPGDTCGGSDFYNCKQMKAKMLVGHADQELKVRSLRNITINIGCSCVYREPVLLNHIINGPEEKRKRSDFSFTNYLDNYLEN